MSHFSQIESKTASSKTWEEIGFTYGTKRHLPCNVTVPSPTSRAAPSLASLPLPVPLAAWSPSRPPRVLSFSPVPRSNSIRVQTVNSARTCMSRKTDK